MELSDLQNEDHSKSNIFMETKNRVLYIYVFRNGITSKIY